jgi:predicted dehydrogenase
MPSSPPVRWAIAGAGRICETFVPDLQAVDPDSVVAIWGRRPQAVAEFAGRHGIPHHTHLLDEVLAREDIDAVYVATPVASHASIAIAALEAGKHVLVEKPMAFSAPEAATIFDAAQANDRFAMEAMWMKFNPLHVEIVRLIAEGLVGEPRFVRAAFGMPFPAGGTRWNAESGGSTVLDQGIYPVTLADWVLGPACRVTATGRVLDGVDVSAQISLEHDDGRVSQSACSIMEFTDPTASISGTTGWIGIPAMFWATDVAQLHAGSSRALFHEPDELSRPREGNGYIPMIRSVVDAIASGIRQHPRHDSEATLRVAAILDAAREQIHARSVQETRRPAESRWSA